MQTTPNLGEALRATTERRSGAVRPRRLSRRAVTKRISYAHGFEPHSSSLDGVGTKSWSRRIPPAAGQAFLSRPAFDALPSSRVGSGTQFSTVSPSDRNRNVGVGKAQLETRAES